MNHTFNESALKRYNRSFKWKMLETFDPKAPHEDTLPFTVAEMEWKTPQPIIDGLKEYLDHEILGYTDVSPTYYDHLNNWLSTYYKFTIKPEDIIITPGVITAIRIAIHTLTQENDGVVLLSPSYNTFLPTIANAGRRVVEVDLLSNSCIYTIDFTALESAFSDPKNTMFILCSPHNPVGRVWTYEELIAIRELASKYNIHVVADEIHADLVMPSYQFVSYGVIDPQAILCTSISKTFNLAGLKVSNIIIKNGEIKQSFQRMADCIGGIGANALALHAVELAYTKCRPWLEEAIERINKNYLWVLNNLNSDVYTVSPLQGTYLLWIDTRNVSNIYEFLREHHIQVGDGKNYGEAGTGFIRVNIACPLKYVRYLTNALNTIATKKG